MATNPSTQPTMTQSQQPTTYTAADYALILGGVDDTTLAALAAAIPSVARDTNGDLRTLTPSEEAYLGALRTEVRTRNRRATR